MPTEAFLAPVVHQSAPGHHGWAFFPVPVDLAYPVSSCKANIDCDKKRENPRFQEKRVVDVLQLDRWGDFVTSFLTSVRG